MKRPLKWCALTLLLLIVPRSGSAQSSQGVTDRADRYVMTQHLAFARAASDARAFVVVADTASHRHRGSFDQMFGQVLGGTFGAIVVGIVAYRLLDTAANHKVKGDDGYSPNANTAYALGSFVGSTALVHLIGMGDGSRSPLWATAIGTAVVTAPLLADRDDPYLPLVGSFLGAPLQAVAGTIGYQLGRRPPR
jgi:hypothetical protein